MRNATGDGMKGRAVEQRRVGKNVFDHKVIGINICARQNRIAQGDIRKYPEGVIALWIGGGV